MVQKCVAIAKILFTIITIADSANILLMFTIPSLSNHVMYRPLIEALAAKNHSIVVATTDPTPEKTSQWPNVREIDLHDISYTVWKKYLLQFAREVTTSKDKLFFNRMFVKMSIEINNAQLSSPAMKALYETKGTKFDVVIGSLLHIVNLGFAEKFEAPFIGIHPSDIMNAMHNFIGNCFHNTYYPDSFYPLARSLYTLQGIEDRQYEYALHSLFVNASDEIDKVIENNLKISGRSAHLLENIDLAILTTSTVWSLGRPVRPNTLYIGDTHLRTGNPLNNDLQQYLDKATNGAVYFCLGSNIPSSSLSSERFRVIIEALKNVPYSVLLKWEADSVPDLPSNIFTSSWFPQQDVLAHPNVKVFVTHGGLLSMNEALYHEVPMVVIPFFGDQPFNAIRIKQLGLGEPVNYASMTSKALTDAIIQVGTNSSYMENIQDLSDRMFDQESTSVHRAVWWIEYIIKHKSGSHFQHPRISTAEYFLIDIIVVIFAILLVAVILIYKITLAFVNRYLRDGYRDMSKRFILAPNKKK